jgi:release factor glutamine methyltransferase
VRSPIDADRRYASIGGLSIAYDDRVLRPRAWTILQAEWAAEIARSRSGPILELFAGVGHIGLVAARLAGRPLIQVDVDPVACGFAVENAWRAGMAHCVSVRCCANEHAVGEGERFSVVISDPPYLRSDEVAGHDDPRGAVDGGPDGLGPARRSLHQIARRLPPGSIVLLQLRGDRQVRQLTGEQLRQFEVKGIRSDGPERAVVRLDLVGDGLDALRVG